ncbi:MAG: hypothetical protein ACKOQM_02660 [Novosphingobium sp.]
MLRRAALASALLLIAACSQPDNASGAGGVSAGEARALDDAAQMVQEQQIPPGAMPKPQSPQPAKPAAPPSAKPPAKPAG